MRRNKQDLKKIIKKNKKLLNKIFEFCILPNSTNEKIFIKGKLKYIYKGVNPYFVNHRLLNKFIADTFEKFEEIKYLIPSKYVNGVRISGKELALSHLSNSNGFHDLIEELIGEDLYESFNKDIYFNREIRIDILYKSNKFLNRNRLSRIIYELDIVVPYFLAGEVKSCYKTTYSKCENRGVKGYFQLAFNMFFVDLVKNYLKEEGIKNITNLYASPNPSLYIASFSPLNKKERDKLMKINRILSEDNPYYENIDINKVIKEAKIKIITFLSTYRRFIENLRNYLKKEGLI
ncbi:MAG: hypothetical protein ABGW69_01605 [Nanoarchaeota archaeon]